MNKYLDFKLKYFYCSAGRLWVTSHQLHMCSLWPDSFLVSGKVSHNGIIIGKKDKYVTRSLNVSGQDKSSGWLSSSSSPPPWKWKAWVKYCATYMTVFLCPAKWARVGTRWAAGQNTWELLGMSLWEHSCPGAEAEPPLALGYNLQPYQAPKTCSVQVRLS